MTHFGHPDSKVGLYILLGGILALMVLAAIVDSRPAVRMPAVERSAE